MSEDDRWITATILCGHANETTYRDQVNFFVKMFLFLLIFNIILIECVASAIFILKAF